MANKDSKYAGGLFSEEEMTRTMPNDMDFAEDRPVTVLGMTFENDEKRREYFREELRKKLPELRKIEGFPIGSDDDIINLSDPPYYTACPNPWINDFIDEWEKEKVKLINQGKRPKSKIVIEPYASDVSEGKFDSLYMYHPYLTKVPYLAIKKYLNHFTSEGDIILDGFAGTGMTGAASRLSEGVRNAICIDLSPLASFVSYCVNSDQSGISFESKARTIIDKTKEELGWMFITKHTNNADGEINYVLWSDSYSCPNCGNELIYWYTAVNKEEGKIKDEFSCPHCGILVNKSNLNKMQETIFDSIVPETQTITKRVPVLISYTYNGKRYEKVPDDEDLAKNKKIAEMSPDNWIPLDKTYNGDELSRCFRDGINYFYQYYTKRNLLVLSKVKSLIGTNPLMNYLLTKLAFQNTIMYRYTYMNGCWGAGGGPMSGTLYVPSLFKELNIINQLNSLCESRKKYLYHC